jgi:glutathione peroxidase
MPFFLLILFAMLMPPKSVHDFTMKDIDGNEVSLERYRGKVLLIVNVASKCGLTPQYAQLQSFYEKYQDKGVEVLGFPANNFMGQEPGTELEIKKFCTNKYQVTFPMFAKISVKGKEMHPLYRFLTEKDLNGAVDAPVKWNFQKFLVDRNGKVIASFDPSTSVDDSEVLKAVEAALKQ